MQPTAAKSKTTRKPKTKAPGAVADPVTEQTVTTFKGFGKDFRCRGFQFEIGKTYEHAGNVVACPTEEQAARGEGGFHACEHPLHVFQYYRPANSRFARVTQSGDLARHTGDTKIASARITIDAELKLPEIVAAAIKWVFDRAKWKEGPVATQPNEGVTASGDSGAATASGDSGAATASGYSGAATASGYYGRVQGKDGCALFLTERDGNRKIIAAWAGIVGKDGINADTWYTLKGGKPVEV